MNGWSHTAIPTLLFAIGTLSTATQGGPQTGTVLTKNTHLIIFTVFLIDCNCSSILTSMENGFKEKTVELGVLQKLLKQVADAQCSKLLPNAANFCIPNSL